MAYQFRFREEPFELYDGAQEVRQREVPRSSPDYIRWVQRSLNEVLRLRLAEDGVAGPLTRSAIRNFQRREWLPVTGTIGPDSERMLIAETGAIPNPVYHADQEALEDEEASFESEDEEAETQILEIAPPAIPVIKEPLPVPPGNPVPFAPPPPLGSYWPVRTRHKYGRLVSYKAVDGTIVGKGRMFLANRTGKRGNKVVPRWHVGVDLFANVGDVVVACEKGTIVAFAFFYNARSGQRTYQLLIDHPGVVVNYGEVTGDSLDKHGLGINMPVKAGQPIGFVSDTSMLHFETYVKGNTRSRRWFKDERKPPPQLLNPTKYLLFLREHGLVGKSVQAALRGELHALENPWREEFSLSGRLQEEKWERPFSEGEEVDLAAELLSVSNEEELDQFLGKLFKGAWKGLKKVGSVVGKFAKPLGRVLKGVAKAALPFVGGALGSVIPGVGTVIGSALGGALSKALEMEFGELNQEEQEFEMARRFVRIAGTAAQQAALASPSTDPQAAVTSALITAARRHVGNLPISRPQETW